MAEVSNDRLLNDEQPPSYSEHPPTYSEAIKGTSYRLTEYNFNFQCKQKIKLTCLLGYLFIQSFFTFFGLRSSGNYVIFLQMNVWRRKNDEIFFFLALLLESGKFLLQPFSTLVLHMNMVNEWQLLKYEKMSTFYYQNASEIWRKKRNFWELRLFVSLH